MSEAIPAEPSPGGRRSVLRDRPGAGLLVGLFALGAGIRAIPWSSVLTTRGIVFPDSDSYLHMWRIWNAAQQRIALSDRDPFVNFPEGGEIPTPPAFDAALAAIIRVLNLDQPSAELLCAFLPVVLGGASVALAGWIAARHFPHPAAWVAGALTAILPGSFISTQLGFLDHHAAITVLSTVLLGGAMRVVTAGRTEPRGWPWIAGALATLAILIQAGTILQVAVLQAALLAWCVGAEDGALARRRGLRLGLAHAVVAVTILPFSLRSWEIFGSFHPLVLTRFQPTWYGAGALCLGAASALWAVPALGRSLGRRVLTASVVGCAVLALAAAAIPDLAAVLQESAAWFGGDDAFLAHIEELRPLVGDLAQPNWRIPMKVLSILFFAFPLALGLVVWKAPRPERWLLVCWSASFGILALSQMRFLNTFAISYAIVWGGAAALLVDMIRERPGNRLSRNAIEGALALVLVAILLVPAWSYYGAWLRGARPSIIEARRSAFREAASWLSRANPVPLDDASRPQGGVLCAWGLGHAVRYLSGWPVHQDGFGPYASPRNTELASRYYRADGEGEAVAILERLGTRYVLADVGGSGQPPYSGSSRTRRLVDLGGSGGRRALGPGRERLWIPALSRHRLVYVARDRRSGVWLYEVVPGAEIVGSAPPGSEISIEIALRLPTGETLTWKDRGRADFDGEYRLRVPYPSSGGSRSAVTSLGPYELRTPAGVTEVEVPEEAVRSGARLSARPPGS